MKSAKRQKASTTLVFLDIDGTLLKPNYRTNSERLPKMIKKLSSKQYVFCLNSNRAIEDLRPIAKKFNINGPLVAENGTFSVIKNKQEMLTKAEPIAEKLSRALKEIEQKEDVRVYKIDTVKNGRRKAYSRNKVLLVNKFRDYTGSIHVRNNGRNDLKLAKQLVRYFEKYFGNDYAISTSKIFSNVLISPKSADKGKAIKTLKEKYYSGSTVVMIGDDSADMPVMNVVDKFFAVGNAEPRVKKHADYEAKLPYTQGVVEILSYLDAGGAA